MKEVHVTSPSVKRTQVLEKYGSYGWTRTTDTSIMNAVL